MTRRLTTHVMVRKPGTAEAVVLGPNDDLPEWAEVAITNPALWSASVAADVIVPAVSPEAPPTAERPPVAGPGSGRDAWAAYATSRQVTVTDDMTRADIIAALPEE